MAKQHITFNLNGREVDALVEVVPGISIGGGPYWRNTIFVQEPLADPELGTDRRLRMRGVKQAGFDVLKTAGVPSILLEVAFITNRDEARLMRARDFQQEFARRVTAGLAAYASAEAADTAPPGATPAPRGVSRGATA